MQNGDEAPLSNSLAGHGLLVKMLIALEPHHICCYFAYLYIFFFKSAGKMTKKITKNGEKYWSCLDSNHCAPGCWIARKPLRPIGHHVLYTTPWIVHIAVS